MDQAQPVERFFSTSTPLLAIVFSLSACLFTYLSFLSLAAVQQSQSEEDQSYLLAEQLRQSSDHLTLMARSYAVTGQRKFDNYYQNILAIRDGSAPLPANYHLAYWDFLLPRYGKAPSYQGEVTSFQQGLQPLHLSQDESGLLLSAEKASNDLSKIELQALRLTRLALTEVDFEHSPSRLKAIELLYSNQYFIAKAKIMAQINQFYFLNQSLTDANQAAKLSRHYIYSGLAVSSFLGLILVLVYSLYRTNQSRKHFAVRFQNEVALRTREIFEKQEQLKAVIKEMELTKQQLVESEKMASLGNLVCGVAHEVNTPLGICVTLASYMQEESNKLLTHFESGNIKRSTFVDFCQQSRENYQILLENLQRAAALVKSFKQIAVDQQAEEARTIRISAYLKDVLLSLEPELNKGDVLVSVSAPDDEPEVFTFPGVIAQIATHLALNAFIHGFARGAQSGHVDFSLVYDKQQVNLTVSDDGRGIDTAIIGKIFEPFFTTDRGLGGAGLGLSIVYNLVVHKLNGHIQCESETGHGAEFMIEFPIQSQSAQ
ncbi:HAMP domain-containing histidine kinase [Motilimonas cestriensis]|uniref:histidine kinase n=1 Tax=Motilimonas cestriensis TaxID=2742685 RepID=A0ABS8W7X7_9GAMM|nr:HAMP domain-containing sensor histidine kinase [Motilimonas cestriensis]MCE2593856.1 HAMP domain-containing histidine kinase [Motilimonas cestriensis]